MSIQIFLGATDRTSYLYQEGGPVNFTLQRGGRGTATLNFIIRAGDAYAPIMGQPVYIHDIRGSDFITFTGTVDSIKRKWIGNDGEHVDTITCVSLEAAYDLVKSGPRGFLGEFAGDIFTDLVDGVAAGVPVTHGQISQGPAIYDLVTDFTTVSDIIFKQLPERAGFVAGIDPSTSEIYFRPETFTASPFTLDDGAILWETMEWSEQRADFRNRQSIRISFNAFALSHEVFLGDGVTTVFTLRTLANQVISASLTTSTRAVGSLTFTGQPSPGDTATINTAVYTFVATLDNTQLAQVKIGASANATFDNFIDAINAKVSTAGTAYSLPTWENDAVNADARTGSTFLVHVKRPGSAGNGVVLASSSGAFSWSTGSTFGGADGSETGLSIATSAAAEGFDFAYDTGGDDTACAVAPPAGTYLSVAYRRLSGDVISVEDTASVVARAAIEGSNGKYQHLLSDTGCTMAQEGLQKAQQLLTQYKTFPVTFKFQHDRPGLLPGQALTFTFTRPTNASTPVISGNPWLVQEVNGTLIPGKETLPDPHGNFRYTVSVISTSQIASYVNFWENLALIGGPSLAPHQQGGGPAAGDPFFCRAILPGIQVVASDILENRYRVTCPSGLHVSLWRATVTAKVPGGASPASNYVADLLLSTNDGVSWSSLFASGSANKVVLPAGTQNAEIYPNPWAIARMDDDDQIRVDVLQCDGVVSGIEIVLEGTFVSG